MPRSVRQYISDAQITLRDTEGSQTIWSFAEAYRSVQEAFRQARGHFRLQEVYTSLTLQATVKEYALPDYIRHIRWMERGVRSATESTPIQYFPILSWRLEPTPETIRLWIDGDYPEAEVRIYYERDIPVPPLEVSLAGNMTSTQGYIPVSNTSAYQQWTWPVPGYVQLENEVIRYEAVLATSFTSLTRGLYNTSPRANSLSGGIGLAHSSNMAITPFIPFDQSDVDQFILSVMRQQMMIYRLHDADSEGSRTVSALAAEYGRQAQEALRNARPGHSPRLAQFRFTPRR